MPFKGQNILNIIFILLKNKKNFIIYKILILALFYFLFILNIDKYLIQAYTNENPFIDINNKKNRIIKIKENISINTNKSSEINALNNKCYLLLDNSNIKIIHLIITRFLVLFYRKYGFPQKMYKDDYISNGIRVMKKYIIPSLENQSCKNFTWILMVGNNANITYIKSLLNFNFSFNSKIIYEKNIKKYVKNITKEYDILITTRIDYDDIIYYDAVNDVRKVINLNRPILLYGYNRGIKYFESINKSSDFFFDKKDIGVFSIFVSLIIVLKKVNDTYIIYDLGDHSKIRKTLLEKYMSFGINKINYEPTIFDNGDQKFAWVRQNYSGTYEKYGKIKKGLKIYDFNLSKFFGK